MQTSLFLIQELRNMPMADLRALFREAFLDPEKLIKGDQKCLCDRHLRAFAKTMDKRLLDLMKMAADYLSKNQKQAEDCFDKADVYGDSSKLNSDFNKLHCWGLVEMVRYRVYRFTTLGLRFLFGEAMIPKRVWVYNDEVILADDQLVSANGLDERWQTSKQDYTFDYVIHRLKTPQLV